MGKVRESVADAVIHDLATLASCAAVSRNWDLSLPNLGKTL